MTASMTDEPFSQRPKRVRIANEFGKLQTLTADQGQFQTFSARGTSPTLLLGLGPEPAAAAPLLGNADTVLFLEAPAFSEQMDFGWKEAIPKHWQALSPDAPHEQLLQAMLPALTKGHVLLHRQAPRLFPSFWGPILGCLRWQALAAMPGAQPQARSVMLPAREDGLLLRELQQGFADCGCQVRLLPDDAGDETLLVRELARDAPALYLSVNFKGLDPYGEHAHLLRAAGVQVAVWCVDNPWNLLSGLKARFWRELQLFVTDASFIAQLRKAGAGNVHHLPLAAWPQGFAQRPAAALSDLTDLAQGFCFVGRSSFPNKNAYFAGQRLPQPLWEEALALLEAGKRPHFHWWQEQLQLAQLWPGKEARRAGLGAEEASLQLRLRCLRHAAALLPLTVFGDANWGTLLGSNTANITLRPPVDYYGALPQIYASARYVLNATSLQLPAGLTQRHFDVWTAGGFLLSDATPGLDIFAKELTRPICLDGGLGHNSLEARLNELEQEPGLRKELQRAWKKELLQEHTYRHRAEKILTCCGLS